MEKRKEELNVNSQKPVRIVAMAKYLPAKVDSVTLEKRHGIPPGWSKKRSGVDSRHHATFESNGYMGARAIEKAIEKAKMDLKDIDMIISASATYDYPLPNQSSIIKSELKNGSDSHAATIDIDSTCLSFVSGFDLAAKLLDGKQYKNIVLVSSEISSKGLNPDSWETLTLFGDGAVAAILSYDEESDSLFIKGGQKTYSEGVEYTIVRGGGNVCFFKDNPYDKELHSFKMEGRKLMRLAKKRLPQFIDWFFENLNYGLYELDVIIPHQASKFGLILFENLFKFKDHQLKGNLIDHGNCIAASIPLVLHDVIESGELRRGDTCLLLGTSAGFSVGSVLIKY